MVRLSTGLRRWLLLAGVTITVATVATSAIAPAQAGNWKSGARTSSKAPATDFAAWRGTSLGMASGWITWKNGWSGMLSYASGYNPRKLRSMSANVSLGHGLFPGDGNLAACAAGNYDKNHADVASRLAANGVGDAEIRLGWEASGDWFPWSAAGKPPEQWKACFVRVARAMKGAAPNLRIGWFMAKKGRIDINTIYPDGPDSDLITNIGVSHYDDAYDRFEYETYKNGPWGLKAFVEFARKKGKKFAIGEWGVGRSGDNPTYIQNMHDFLDWAGDSIAHEAYFNTKEYQLYPTTKMPKSAALYQKLF